MIRINVIAAAIAVCLASVTQAAPVAIDVRGADGKPLAGAVVTVEVAGVSAPAPRGPYSVEQRNIQFEPHLLIVPVGAVVTFPNRDKVRHHVYSFSKPKKFDLKLYGREEARSIAFDQPGIVALGCNIHDAMSGFIFVTATPFVAQTDAAGRVSIDKVPAGAAKVTVWHPTIRASGNVLSQAVKVTPAGLDTHFAIRR